MIEGEALRICRTCEIPKSLEHDFHTRAVQTKKGTSYYTNKDCRDCFREYSHKRYLATKDLRRARETVWRHANPEKMRAAWLRRKYGISPEQYDQMFADQDGKCLICEQEETALPSLPVDHDHVTGKIRGLLCTGCNAGIGSLGENPERLRRAADYVERHAAL